MAETIIPNGEQVNTPASAGLTAERLELCSVATQQLNAMLEALLTAAANPVLSGELDVLVAGMGVRMVRLNAIVMFSLSGNDGETTQDIRQELYGSTVAANMEAEDLMLNDECAEMAA